jgi:ribosome-associated protein
MTKNALPDLDPSLALFVEAVRGLKAKEIVMLDLRPLTAMADVFIICSGGSNRQVTAIANHINSELKKHDIRPLNIEGKQQGHWVLLDYGHVVIHVFYETVRTFYDLEGLWSDARRIDYQQLIKATDA